MNHLANLPKKPEVMRTVFTNGCFDILHKGHVRYLLEAASLGDELVVGVNSDRSVRLLKGAFPANNEDDRAIVVSSLSAVNRVVIFNEKRADRIIRKIRPQVYVKGGDYNLESIDPAEKKALKEIGCEIQFASLVEGSSSTLTKNKLPVSLAFRAISECLSKGGKVLTCGNGGSCAEALHLTQELMGKFREPRAPLASVCLCSDPSVITCIANDFGFEEIFSRQVKGLGRPGDVLVGFSTSGKSPNIVKALQSANEAGMNSIFLGGGDGGECRRFCNIPVLVESESTARIQEAHTFIIHQWMEQLEP